MFIKITKLPHHSKLSHFYQTLPNNDDVNVVLYLSAFLLICRWLFHAQRFPDEIQKARLGDGARVTRIARELANSAPYGISVNSRDKTIFWTESGECCRHFGSYLRYVIIIIVTI